MPRAWRIVKHSLAARAFEGEGARLYGGRWNSPGVAVVYLAESRALAMLEVLVHLGDEELLKSFVLVGVEYEARHCKHVEAAILPKNWTTTPAPAALRQIGDEWCTSKRSPLLSVPSAVVPSERNLLLDPNHPAFSELSISKPERIAFDPRLRR